MSRTKLAQLVEMRRAEYQKQLDRNHVQNDSYVESVRVDFIAVLERHLRNSRSAA